MLLHTLAQLFFEVIFQLFVLSTSCMFLIADLVNICVNSQRALNLSPEPQWEPGWELELLELLEELEPPLPVLLVVLGTSFSTRSHSSRGSAALQRQQSQESQVNYHRYRNF